MNATKRKFNALVQGLGTRTSSEKPGSESATESATRKSSDGSRLQPTSDSAMPTPARSSALSATEDLKRRRVGGASITAVGGHGSSKSVTTISNIVLKKYVAPKDAKEAPRYCPADREQLIRRLATFQDLTDWTPKPDQVNEIEWAKRGWVCKGKERVQCSLCHKELVVKLNKKTVDGKEVSVLVASEIEEKLVDKYVEMMETSHQEDCLWRKRGCDDSLLRLALTDAVSSTTSLKTRYGELLDCQSFLPYSFNLRLPAEFDLEAVLSYLPADFFAPGETPNKVALSLALMGWQSLVHRKTGQPVPNSASCKTCLRRLGLWMFKSKEVDPETNQVIVPAPMDHLDPVREHRSFCPWRNAMAQLNSGSRRASIKDAMPAWQVLLTSVKNDSYLRNREKGSSSFFSRRPRSRGGQSERERQPATPGRANGNGKEPATPTTPAGSLGYGLGEETDEEKDKEEVAKDKERWARLRRVKSMFSTKDGKKLKRSQSRPGTGHTTLNGDKEKVNEKENDASGITGGAVA
ncbi:C3HC zinc finger domain-containing protein [Zalerion maritima]|uniref:C3HC zinc finger domain-containing protein n=1 Tax=Zalerion maritima TaxID=339359 RepID=A0AAD5RI47_9PEZI|nr:C3HC zinc finger domain-containing protein [Zalerion maritima]